VASSGAALGVGVGGGVGGAASEAAKTRRCTWRLRRRRCASSGRRGQRRGRVALGGGDRDAASRAALGRR
jgi:hypothetical protein